MDCVLVTEAGWASSPRGPRPGGQPGQSTESGFLAPAPWTCCGAWGPGGSPAEQERRPPAWAGPMRSCTSGPLRGRQPWPSRKLPALAGRAASGFTHSPSWSWPRCVTRGCALSLSEPEHPPCDVRRWTQPSLRSFLLCGLSGGKDGLRGGQRTGQQRARSAQPGSAHRGAMRPLQTPSLSPLSGSGRRDPGHFGSNCAPSKLSLGPPHPPHPLPGPTPREPVKWYPPPRPRCARARCGCQDPHL